MPFPESKPEHSRVIVFDMRPVCTRQKQARCLACATPDPVPTSTCAPGRASRFPS